MSAPDGTTAPPARRPRSQRRPSSAGDRGRVRRRRVAAVRASRPRCSSTSGSACWPSTCASRSSPSGSAWPGAAAGCCRSARACSSASAATRWPCTSSWPTPAPASCRTSCSCTGSSTRCPGGGSRSRSPAFTLLAIVAAADAGRAAAGPAVFKRRVRGAYFAILSQALAAAFAILLVGQQGTTGGTNGLTDFQDFFGFDLDDPANKRMLYFIAAGALLAHARGGPAADAQPLRRAAGRGPRRRGAGALPRLRPGQRQARRLRRRRRHGRHRPARCSCRSSGIISPALIGVVPSIGS